MPSIYSEQFVHAWRDLFLAAMIYLAYKSARGAAEKQGRWAALWKGGLMCLAIGLLAASWVGEPSCEESGDGLYGGCEEYADDGYTASTDERGARFLYVFLIFFVPVVGGVMEARKYALRPWGRPEAPAAETSQDKA